MLKRKEKREWCRKKYGSDWWKNGKNKARLIEAHAALSGKKKVKVTTTESNDEDELCSIYSTKVPAEVSDQEESEQEPEHVDSYSIDKSGDDDGKPVSQWILEFFIMVEFFTIVYFYYLTLV